MTQIRFTLNDIVTDYSRLFHDNLMLKSFAIANRFCWAITAIIELTKNRLKQHGAIIVMIKAIEMAVSADVAVFLQKRW